MFADLNPTQPFQTRAQLKHKPFYLCYARLPGLLARAARETLGTGSPCYPIAVVDDSGVRDVCPHAAGQNVRLHQPERHARRACPFLHTVTLSQIDPRCLGALTERFLRPLADYTGVIELDGADAAYCDFAHGVRPDNAAIATLCAAWNADLQTGFAPRFGWGTSRNASRACAEDDLSPTELLRADARHLWPEDPSVYARLFRLGLATYGAVAAVGESALVYQFGKKGRLLYARSVGRDFTPVRPMYPPAEATVEFAFPLDPITDEAQLIHVIGRAAKDLSSQLRRVGRHARCMTLGVELEAKFGRATPLECGWVLPAPIQAESDVLRVLRRLRRQIVVTAPVQALWVRASDLDLPLTATGSLFDGRAAERTAALTATRQKLAARFGVVTLRRGAELAIPRREMRRRLRQEKLGA